MRTRSLIHRGLLVAGLTAAATTAGLALAGRAEATTVQATATVECGGLVTVTVTDTFPENPTSVDVWGTFPGVPVASPRPTTTTPARYRATVAAGHYTFGIQFHLPTLGARALYPDLSFTVTVTPCSTTTVPASTTSSSAATTTSTTAATTTTAKATTTTGASTSTAVPATTTRPTSPSTMPARTTTTQPAGCLDARPDAPPHMPCPTSTIPAATIPFAPTTTSTTATCGSPTAPGWCNRTPTSVLAESEISIVTYPAATVTGRLPRTGDPFLATIVKAATVLVALGFLLVVARRTRRRPVAS